MDPVTHLKDALYMGRGVGNAAGWIIPGPQELRGPHVRKHFGDL